MFTEASSKGLRDGSKAEGFSPHRTKTQGGFPPYLRAAIVPGQGGRLCRGTRPCHPAGATDCAHIGWGGGGICREL